MRIFGWQFKGGGPHGVADPIGQRTPCGRRPHAVADPMGSRPHEVADPMGSRPRGVADPMGTAPLKLPPKYRHTAPSHP